MALIFVALSITSCSDEKLIDTDGCNIPGVDVTVKIPISLPEMEVKSRAELDEVSLNQIDNLWIRTYSADSEGKATSEWLKIDNPQNDGLHQSNQVEINTQSGKNYIVAVANVESNKGVTNVDQTPQKLSVLLDAANTWQDFLNIAVVSPSSLEYVRAPLTPLPMAGCFSIHKPVGTHPTSLSDWQTIDFTPCEIPTTTAEIVDFTTKGAIHLRRLVSHVTFNFNPGENINLTVNSYRVMNAPKFSWLYERAATNGIIANFGDQSKDATDALKYYYDVPQYGIQYITVNEDGSSTFDFWQGENKHTGTCNKFTDRDKKTTSSYQNTLFTSLTGNAWTPNNEASYVVVDCSIEHKGVVYVNDKGEIVQPGDPGYNEKDKYTRTGHAIYIIHLGYINDQASDFNCYRNVDYTYKVTVNGVSDIVVDAFATEATGEKYHGEEGSVIDLSENTIAIDAHYGVFNIELDPVKDLGDNFGFIITNYDDGEQITLTEENVSMGENGKRIVEYSKGKSIPEIYYNWIELRPTTGPDVLAEYKPRYGDYADGKTFLLTDLIRGKASSVYANMNDKWKADDSGKYYTVFVNEYTYEPMYTGDDGYADESFVATTDATSRPNWMRYVNQNPRRFYIKVSRDRSPDGNSVYSHSKYGISQRSLMTYYSDQTFAPASGTIPAGTAIAIERVNESEGINLRFPHAGGSSKDNGRYNTADKLNVINASTTWSTWVDQTKALKVEAPTNNLQGGPEIKANTFQMPDLQRWVVNNPTFTDPQNSPNTIQVINACTNRNRDNNGNGVIDPDELRWYVPAINQYLQMVTGSKALPSPLMDFKSIKRVPYVVNKNSFSTTPGEINNCFYTRYMFVSSDSQVLWGVEGTSTSNYSQANSWANGLGRPWQVRCLRNLGTNLTTFTSENKVSKTYVHNRENHTIMMKYFNPAVFRANPYKTNGTGSGQMPLHTINSPYNRLYYGFEYQPKYQDIHVNPAVYRNTEFKSNDTIFIYKNLCKEKYGTGWRVPNQVELSLMCQEGDILIGGGYTFWLSCTVNYFNSNDGAGNDEITGKYYLVSYPNKGSQATPDNISDAGGNIYIRCVKDLNPE